MTASAQSLRQLHRIHQQLSDVRDRIERGPRQILGGEKNVERLEETLAESERTLKQTKVAVDQKQLQLKANEDRIAEWRIQLNRCKGNREYQTLLEQIAAADMANSVLSDEILEMLEKIDQCDLQVAGARSNVEKGQAELAKIKDRVRSERASLQSELARLEEELKTAEASLSSRIKPDYQRLARARGEDAMARVDGESCSGCYHTITPQMINELRLSKAVFCKACGRLLYLPEDRSPL